MFQKGYKKLLLPGGTNTNTSFLIAGLVDEILLTVEPKIFGLGKQLFLEKSLEASLELLSFKKLNKQGTLLLHYQIKKIMRIIRTKKQALIDYLFRYIPKEKHIYILVT